MAGLILMYHDISDDPGASPAEHRPYVLTRRAFHEQVKSIVRSELPVLTVAEWCSSARPERTLILTFDDGHVSNHSAAFPILREFGLKATFFITAGRIGTGETMNWSEIRELHAAGMEIGSHTLTHRSPSTLSDTELEYELSESRRILEDGLGAPVTSISSPTGFFNPRMCDLAQKVGYRALCIGRIGLVTHERHPFALNRVAVKRSMNGAELDALLKFNRFALWQMRARQWPRELARQILGPTGYLKARRILLTGSLLNHRDG
jgi:peptidoglycan/xylan/chitin deacetylase (PgdA/CDA1 family)